MKNLVPFLFILLLVGCNSSKEKKEAESKKYEYEAISILGDTLRSKAPSEELVKRYMAKKAIYDSVPGDLDNLIWYGRFTAYMGNYREAIDIYTSGLEKFPDESRLLRHRGHRYISVREFDKAIADLEKAAQLIKGKHNETEQDGMPNARNIPVSTRHGNIYYHLGLAYYLNNEMRKSLEAYKLCLETSKNPDNVVSATHWIYMLHRRMGRKEAAEAYLQNISADMDVIENTAYHRACLYYKGELALEEVYSPDADGTPSNSALKYGVGNWYFYNADPTKAEEVYKDILSGDDWASFGYIAAEVDFARL